MTGIDLSGPMLERARPRVLLAGLANVCFELGDAEAHRFDQGAFDAGMSRFGVMFFENPQAAFRKIACALARGGILAFLCWQEMLANEWITVPGAAAAPYVPLPAPTDPTAAGPFALADPDYVTELLRAAGFGDVQLIPVFEPLIGGADPLDAVAFLRNTGIGRTLLASADAVTMGPVESALQEALAGHVTPAGVSLGSAAWMATASR